MDIRRRMVRRAVGLATAGGLIQSTPPDTFVATYGRERAPVRRQDLRLYSPLCLALGAGAATIARTPR